MLLATSVFGVGRLLCLRRVVDGQRRVHAGFYHVVDETQPAREKPFRLPRMVLGSLLKIGLGHDLKDASTVISRIHPLPLRMHPRTSQQR